jgi:ABC-type spermidine/putrescine transport system permease subunit II
MGKRLLQAHAVLVYLFLYAPIVVVVVFAFNGGRRVLLWEGFSTRWFGEAWRDDDIRTALENSLVVATANALLACVLGTMLALGLSRLRAWIRTPLDTLAYMTLVTPEIVFAVSALIFFVQADEWMVNAWGKGLAGLFGAASPLELWGGKLTILVSHVVFNATVVALVVRARFVGMGQTLEEASFDLGAGPLATFRQVTLPRLAPAILAGGLLAFTFSFDDFYTSFFVAGTEGTTLPVLVFASLRFGVTPAITATATMIIAVSLAGILLAYLFLRRTEHGRQTRATVPGI